MLKAPIIGIERHRLTTDGQGVTTLVAFHGCPLHCRYCLNPQCLVPEGVKRRISTKQLLDEVAVDDLYFQATGGGICFGGGEPLLHTHKSQHEAGCRAGNSASHPPFLHRHKGFESRHLSSLHFLHDRSTTVQSAMVSAKRRHRPHHTAPAAHHRLQHARRRVTQPCRTRQDGIFALRRTDISRIKSAGEAAFLFITSEKHKVCHDSRNGKQGTVETIE